MANINKKLLAKRDMNFFAEFTANAARTARMLGYAVAVGILVVLVVVTLIVAFFIRNELIKSDIRKLKDLLAGPDYANLEAQAVELQQQLEQMNDSLYAKTQMRKTVDRTLAVPMELPGIIGKSIPSDTVLTSYEITGSTLAITGNSFTYYSPVDMVNILNESKVFTAVSKLDPHRKDPTEIGPGELFWDSNGNGKINNWISNYYEFEIEGSLVSKVYISLGRYLNGKVVKSLAGLETEPYDVSTTYDKKGNIATYQTGGKTYSLTKVTVNGTAVSDEALQNIINKDEISCVATGNIDIALYYDTPEAVAASQASASAEAAAAQK